MENFKKLLDFVEERLKKKHQPDVELVKKYNADPLNKDWQIPKDALWEQSDVVHDILAFLAERIIEMNKEKQREINGFLSWLEGYLEVKVEDLKNRTKIKYYYQNYYEDFIEILKTNKKKIPKIDITRRQPQDEIKIEFESSATKLFPLLSKIEDTDNLIDQIVYKLYNLTPEEIEVVESSNKK